MILFPNPRLHSNPIPMFTSSKQENSSLFLYLSSTPTQILPSFTFSSTTTLLCELYIKKTQLKMVPASTKHSGLLTYELSCVNELFMYSGRIIPAVLHAPWGLRLCIVPLFLSHSFSHSWEILFDEDWITQNSKGLEVGQREGGRASRQKEQLLWRSWGQK